jgi:hypothetical protein
VSLRVRVITGVTLEQGRPVVVLNEAPFKQGVLGVTGGVTTGGVTNLAVYEPEEE